MGIVVLPTELKVHMVETRLMVAQHDQGARAEGLEASVSDAAHPETIRVDVLEQRLQGLTANMQLLMEQNWEIIQELWGWPEAPDSDDTTRRGSRVPPAESYDWGKEDEVVSITASHF